MKLYPGIVFMFFLCASLFGAGEKSKEVVENGISINISLDQTHYLVSSPVNLTIKVTNISNENEVGLIDNGLIEAMELEVWETKNKPYHKINQRKYGALQLNRYKTTHKRVWISLAKGSSHELTIDLARFFDLSMVSEYSVEARIPYVYKGEVEKRFIYTGQLTFYNYSTQNMMEIKREEQERKQRNEYQTVLEDDPSLKPLPKFDDGKVDERVRVLADLNGDGLEDMLLSESTRLFGNAGGYFTIYYQTENNKYRKYDKVFMHTGAFTFEKAGKFRLWIYSRCSSSSGNIGYYIFGKDGLSEFKSIEINPGDGGTNRGNNIYRSVFGETDIPYKVQGSKTENGKILWSNLKESPAVLPDKATGSIYERWKQNKSYYDLLEIIDLHIANRPDYNRATRADILKYLGKPNWGTVMQDEKRQIAYSGKRHVPYGSKVIFTFNEKDELIKIDWVSE